MREAAFIKQNKEKWLNFEQAFFVNREGNPEVVANLYIQIVNDLAYAKTYYPKSKTIDYLNELAAKAYLTIYKTRRTSGNRLVRLWKYEVPELLYTYRRYLLYSFALFFTFVLIGVVSARYDESFVRLILGDSYVNQTLQNIKEGDPVAVYKGGSNWGSFIGITVNNIKVGITSYVLGIFGGIGTGYVMLNNGIMLGAFQYFFYEKGVFWTSVRGIWIHGSMEIFAIVIEGAAGLILGASVLFPKTYSRMNSFKRGFRNSFKILVSTFPFTIAAGFLEGFTTRYSNVMPNFLSVFIILGTLSVISYYYLIYPFVLHRNLKKIHAVIQKA